MKKSREKMRRRGDLLRSILLKNITFLVNITKEEQMLGGLISFSFSCSAVTPSQSVFLVFYDDYLFGLASGPYYVVMCYALLNPLVLKNQRSVKI